VASLYGGACWLLLATVGQRCSHGG
jgi:hypothetical protein